MWPFNTKSLKKSGIFNGFTDWHSHILPGVDDGIQNIEDSLAVLNTYEELGFSKVWLTPHIMEDYPNQTAMLKEKFNELKSRWNGNVEISLAAENMLDSLYETRLNEKDLLPIGDERAHLLVETSYYTPPYGMEEMIEKTKAIGYFPILAHPERYRYMDEKDYERWKKEGILFQMNILSLVGGYGETAQRKAHWLLDNDMIDLVGSDLHNLDSVMEWIRKSPKKKTYLDKLFDVVNKKNKLL